MSQQIKTGDLVYLRHDAHYAIVLEQFAHDKACKYCGNLHEQTIPVFDLQMRWIRHYTLQGLQTMQSISSE